ncbi:MAG: Glu/Leu/Phe/Val dehydrogenase [Chloroflexi bacterium]|nr:Glu/Leu/Phe/Val dehydrogenase [Chloroflexota bacterium]
MNILDYMDEYEYEELAFYTDKAVGLRAIIAVHDTTLGPALGGARVWPFASEEDAVLDVLRLARAMTYKSSAAGLMVGGGKAVIIADAHKDKNEAMMRAFGRFTESLGGRYITTDDVGSDMRDMEYIRTQTKHVFGVPVHMGGSGDSTPPTGLGIYSGMRACAKEVFGTDSVKGKTVAIQGMGKVGYQLAKHLKLAGATIVAADIYADSVRRAREEFGAEIVDPEGIYDVECDVFAPCALGGILNSRTIPRLKCQIVAGGANNQLLEDADAERLAERGILYGPDFILNAGGVINLSLELTGYNADASREKVMSIYQTMERVIARAKSEGITTARAAEKIAEERIAAVKRVR